MKRVLWISSYAPYDQVGHAGGKAENYFLKGVYASGTFYLDVITCYEHEEKNKLDLDKYGIPNEQIDLYPNKAVWIFKKLINAESTLNPWNRNGCILQNHTEFLLKGAIKRYFSENNQPDVVVLQWTETVLLQEYIKRMFPDVKILAIEEDVSFLGYQRRVRKEKNFFIQWILNKRYQMLKGVEIEALQHVDKIMVYNDKDAQLLINNNVLGKKIFVVSTYFDDFSACQHRRQNKDILFYGAMYRPENYLSAIWFIENVFPKMKDKGYRFIIIGSKPPKKLLRYNSRQIQILGYIENVSKYFQSSLCLVAPLLLGAGIKVKILEAMSAGIPVLTNDIGIEGIPARNNKEFIYCKTSKDYVKGIEKIFFDKKFEENLTNNSKKFLLKNFDREKSLEKLIMELQCI